MQVMCSTLLRQSRSSECDHVVMSDDAAGQRLVSTGVAARELGIDRTTLGRWAAAGSVQPASQTLGGHLRWDVDQLRSQIERLQRHEGSM